VPDEFPTLEVVALIGVIAAVVRTWQLRSALAEIPKLGRELEQRLRAGDLAGARSLFERTEAAAFARVASAVTERLARDEKVQPNELRRVVREAKKRATSAVQRKRARDLVVAAVLIGAGAYGLGSRLGVGPAFYVLLGAALLLTAVAPVLRRATLSSLETASDGLLAAALEYRSSAAADGGPCPECGARSALELGGATLGALPELGIETLRVCRECGAVRGRARDPEAIVLDEPRGVRRADSLPPSEGVADPESEHQG
jgi:hypothetical protein